MKISIRYLLATLFCTLIIASTFGSSFAIMNSFAQAQQQQTQQAPTIVYKSPWNDNLQNSSAGSIRSLCQGGICTESSNPASRASTQPTTQPQNTGTSSSTSTNSVQPTTQPQNTGTSSSTSTNSVQPTTQPQNTGTSSSTSTNSVQPTTTKVSTSLKNTFTNSKNLSLNHGFVSSRIIGPDRFRFVTSYWSTSDVSRLIDAGRSAGNVTSQFTGGSNYAAPSVSSIGPALFPRIPFAGFVGGTGAGPFPFTTVFTSGAGGGLPLSNLQIEVDRGEGYSTLAVVLQYEGVVNLAGITAALKLPTGFEAQYPLTDDRHNFDIALSNYDGGIRPSQEVVLYFPMNVLPNAPVQIPVLGPLALHFLRNDLRSVGDSLATTEQNMFTRALTITNGTNQTMFNNSLGLNTNYFDKSGRFIPYDFINQVIPVVFKVTGREVLDVSQSCIPGTPAGGKCQVPIITPSLNIINNTQTPPEKRKPIVSTIVPVQYYIKLTNFGDVPLYNLVVQLGTVLPVISSNTGQVAPQLPIAIDGPTTFYVPQLEPGLRHQFTLYPLISSALNCWSNQALEVDSSYNNIIGVRVEQSQVVGVTTIGNSACPLAPGSSGTLPPTSIKLLPKTITAVGPNGSSGTLPPTSIKLLPKTITAVGPNGSSGTLPPTSIKPLKKG
jgi:hypothetical protein